MINKECIFCKIVQADIPSFKIAEDDKFLAILDIAQFTQGHTIVIPKDHYEFIWDVPNVNEYYEFIKSVGNHFRSLGFKYVDTLTLGRMVSHAHVHLMPHNDEDSDWKNAISNVDNLALDEGRRLTPEAGKILQKRFSMV